MYKPSTTNVNTFESRLNFELWRIKSPAKKRQEYNKKIRMYLDSKILRYLITVTISHARLNTSLHIK